MYRLLARLGLRLTVASTPSQRWRFVLVTLGCALFTLSLCATVSFATVSQRNAERNDRRLAVGHLGSGAQGVPILGGSLPILDGRQFEITWLGVTSDSSVDAFPEGPPSPGEAFVSPGLLRASGGAAGVERRYGVVVSDESSDVKWESILAYADEYVMYATSPRPSAPAERTLTGFGPTAATLQFTLDETMAPTRPDATQEIVVGTSIDERIPPIVEAVAHGACFLVVPALVALISAFGAASSIRTERRAALGAIGATRWHTSIVDAVECLLAAAVGASPIMVVWLLVSRRMTHLPGTRLPFRPGDASPSVAGVALVVALVLVVPCAVGLSSLRLAAWRDRRAVRRDAATSLGVVTIPLAIAVVGGFLPRDLAPIVFAALVLSTLVVIPRLGRGVLSQLGHMVGESRLGRTIGGLVGGRRLAAADRAAGRSFVIAASCMVVLSLVFGFLEREQRNGGVQAAAAIESVQWADPTRDEIEDFLAADRLDGIPLAVVSGSSVFADDCEAASRLVGWRTGGCATHGPELLEQVAGEFASRGLSLEVGPPSWGDDLQLVARVSSPSEHEALESTVGEMFGPGDVSGFNRLGPGRVTLWLGGFGVAAGAVFAVAYAWFLLNAVRDTSPSERALRSLSPDQSQLRAVQRVQTFVPALLGVCLGAGVGLFLNNAGQGLELTRIPYAATAVGGTAIAAFALVAAEVGVRSAR